MSCCSSAGQSAFTVCFSHEGKRVPSVTVIFLHTYRELGIHTWPVNTNQIVRYDSLCCSNLIFCNSYAYLWLTKLVLANVRAVTKANLVRHSSSRFISLSKVFLNKVSSKKHVMPSIFPGRCIDWNKCVFHATEELNDRSCTEYNKCNYCFIATMIITVSHYWWQQHLVIAETHLHTNKNPPPV